MDRKALTEVVQTLALKSPAKAKGVGDSSSANHVGSFLSRMTADDDPEAFMVTFERSTESEC